MSENVAKEIGFAEDNKKTIYTIKIGDFDVPKNFEFRLYSKQIAIANNIDDLNGVIEKVVSVLPPDFRSY